jgi:hypothetical protein
MIRESAKSTKYQSAQPTALTIKAIQKNVSAHTPWCKYHDLYESSGEETHQFLGVSLRRKHACDMVESAASSFKKEFAGQFSARGTKDRARSAALREALAILEKAARELDMELYAIMKRASMAEEINQQ